MTAWQLWREDKAAVAQELEAGRALDGRNSAFGDNDLIVGFLMVEGFWSVLVETQADLLKKENGYPSRILNGLWALCELAGVERISQSGKVLGDEALLRMAGFQDVPMYDDKNVDHGPCQAVIAEEYDLQGERLLNRPRFHYVTSLPVDPASAATVQQVRTYYRRRWSVENQGFWVLTKRWNLDTLAARNLNAIRARLNFALQLYNAENCCAWKHPGDFQDELPRLKRPPKGERLGRASIMVYTPEGKVGAFQANEYENLIRKASKTDFKAKIRQGLEQGRSIEDILRDL